jgi:thioredoxin 1
MAKRLLPLLVIVLIFAGSLAQSSTAAFDGVDKWAGSLAATDITLFKSLYSTNPPAQFAAKGQHPTPDISPETDFWQGLVSSGASDFKVNTLEKADRQGIHMVTLAVSMKLKSAGGHVRYVTEQQGWQQQAAGWRIVVAKHSDVVKMPPALKPNPNLYDPNANARNEIDEAVAAARKNHQRIILVFGANWCYDCHVLDQAFHAPDVVSLLGRNFQVVHVDIGDDGKKNNDIAVEYKVPLEKGIPALAILDPEGKLLYSQKNGEWESARSLDPDDVVAFLEKWKP